MNTKAMGERSEAIILAELLKAGYVVLLPFGDNQRYDMVVEDESGTFRRVQCKTARLIKGGTALYFKTASTYAHRGRPQRDYRGDADLFGVYSPDTQAVYVVPVEDVGVSGATLRLKPSRNGQLQSVRLADDYRITVPKVA